MPVCVFEDPGYRNLEPLTLTRPTFGLRIGAGTILERQTRVFGDHEVTALVEPRRAALCRLTHPDLPQFDRDFASSGRLTLVNARWLPSNETTRLASERGVYVVDGEIAYAVVNEADVKGLDEASLSSCLLQESRETLPRKQAGGRVVRYPWDLLEFNAAAVEADCRNWAASRTSASLPQGVALLGPKERVRIDPSARIEPQVVIDATKGPVLIDRDAVVQAFSRLEGPCYVGPRTQILSARVRGSSFGPECRIGGEVEATIVHGYSNKSHDGFLGHSYIGEWVNLAAGSITSDLRTDYGTVRMSVGGASVDTGLMKVGAFIGDHTRTSIGALLNTGTIVGPFAQLLTSGSLLPRFVPAFCQFGHGRLHDRTDLKQLFATADTAMARRGQPWTEAHADLFFDLYEETAEERSRVIREGEQRRLRRVV